MSLPVTALVYDQLKFKDNDTALENSSNKVRTATVMIDGEAKICFFKKISDNYPEYLAKNCVGISVIMRMAIGERAAEERLVYSADGKEIVGTLSIGIPGFQPLKFITFIEIAKYLAEKIGLSKKDQKSTYDERYVKPGVETLLLVNFIELVVKQWAVHQDDFHPGNATIAEDKKNKKDSTESEEEESGAVIDYDMSPYDFVAPVKGNRLVDGVSKPYPNKTMKLKSCQLDMFPIRDGKDSPTHWPTHEVPGNYYATKAFASFEAFRALAANPVLDLPNGRKIEYQEQLFTALLKELLTYDKETLRARLKEYLGDTPLDFKKLEKTKRDNLLKIEHAKTLFTDKTDQEPYADYMTEVGHLLYQELYRAVVFYAGTPKNEAGVPVVSFKNFVHNKPSAYRKVMDWIKGQNKKINKACERKNNTKIEEDMASSWDDYFKKKEQGVKVRHPLVFSGYAMPEEARYDLNKVMHRFNGVWRDAHLPTITGLMKESAENIRSLAKELNIELNEPISSFAQLNDITSASEYFGDNKIKLPSRSSNANLAGLNSLLEFHNSLADKIKRYMELKLMDLTVTENQALRQHIIQTIMNSRSQINKDLGPQTQWAKSFLNLIPKLEQFCSAFDIECREAADDLPLHNPVEQVHESVQEDHCKPEIIKKCLAELFKWADEQEKEGLLQGMIVQIIKIYTPASYAIVADRNRGPGVKEYVKQSEESGANKLAYILSVGGSEKNSLNTLLIKHLIPLMVGSTRNQGEPHIKSLKSALEHGSFNPITYTTSASAYAKNNPDFTHRYSHRFAVDFNTAMYRWIDKMDRSVFLSIKNAAWKKYIGWNLIPANRNKSEIDTLFSRNELQNSEILASIFGKVDSGYENNSFNTILFEMLRKQMVSSVASHHATDEKLKPLLSITDENKDHFIGTLYGMTPLVLKKKSEPSNAMALSF